MAKFFFKDDTVRRGPAAVCVRVINGWDLPNDVFYFFGNPNESKFFEIVFQEEKNV